jgi:threonyl-tRNA synthetase
MADRKTPREILSAAGKLDKDTIAVKLRGKTVDLHTPVEATAADLTPIRASDPEGLAVIRHSTAHVMADAVQRLFPGTKVTIGPAIEDGFYYDFDKPGGGFTEEDLARIEQVMLEVIKKDTPFRRAVVERGEARMMFQAMGESYKLEIIDAIPEGEEVSVYKHGAPPNEWIDVCEGPHVPSTGFLKAVRLTHVAGAYWRGDERNTQLTRIYGTAFYSQADLDAYLERLEEARRRDHRLLGRELDLFHMSEHSPGSPFWHPKGMVIWNELEDLRRRENRRRGYLEVKTPLLYDQETYVTSGHFENYEENIFWVQSHEQNEHRFALKPMNCPGHMILFGSRLRSYKDLPMRFAESSTLHRDEKGGTLHGLLRVKHITQDDAHIFCRADQIEDEIFGCLDFASFLYELFGLEARFELSTRPDHKLGSDEEWDFTEGALRAALERRGIDYVVNEGDGAFYGPKIDLHMTDAIGRSWQMGTIQLDAQMPQRFGLTYMGADNREHSPYVVHRALLGSLERFVGILVEHYAGAFPFWLAPVQIRVIPVGETHRDAAVELAGELRPHRVEVDASDETVGKRIRNAEVDKIPFVVVYGDKESAESLAIREHGGGQSTLSLAAFQAKLGTLEPWQAGAEPSLTS